MIFFFQKYLNINNHSLNDDEKLEAVKFFKIKCNHSPFSELFFIDRDPTIIYEDYDNDINNKRLRNENCGQIIRQKRRNKKIKIIILINYAVIMKLY